MVNIKSLAFLSIVAIAGGAAGLRAIASPGEKFPAHHHAGSVFAYVLSGPIRSENSATGPAWIYRTGESFFEPAGSFHVVSENSSATQAASLLAVFEAPDGAQLTTPEQR